MNDAVNASPRTGPSPGIEAQFRALYGSGIIGILRADAERILDANDAFLAMIQYSRVELEAGALRWRAMTPPEYAELDSIALEELRSTGMCTPFEKEYYRKDGSRVPILIAATVLVEAPDEWICYVLDLTAARRAATADRTLAVILEHVPVGIIVVDQAGRLMLMNEAGRRISGTVPSPSSSVADQAEAYVLREPGTGRPLAPEETPIARALAGEVIEHYEYLFRPPGSAIDRWIRAVAVPLVDDEGRRNGAVAVFEDVTAERARARAREDFLSAAAHDLKSPLTSITGFSQLLERRMDRDGVLSADVARPHLQQIRRTVGRMSDLISELLDSARLQAGEKLELNRTDVDLVHVVRRIVAEYAEVSPDHAVRLHTPRSSLPGFWDAPRLERAIGNLISNAITYSPQGGAVTLTLDRQEQDGRPWAVLQVRDQGLGIPPGDLPQIFDRFFRGSNVAQFGGTGIGLTGVKQIVDQHGGRVTAKSREGMGSTFTVWLPLERDA